MTAHRFSGARHSLGPGDALRAALEEPEQNDARGNNPNIMFLNQLRNMMREGDIVLASRGTRNIQAVGIVSGPYRFERREIDDYHHRRSRCHHLSLKEARQPVH